MNIIDAILTLIERNEIFLVKSDSEKDAKHTDFKIYVKNLFANSFSYIGSQVETPDLMLEGGDAIEVKTILLRESDSEESIPSRNILLSNVPPMQFIDVKDPLISDNCRYFMQRKKIFRKDILYIVGVIKEKRLRCLSMVYGQDYCASNDCYSDIRNKIKNLYQNEKIIQDNSAAKKELARINNFDPLGLTQVRLNANWYIQNPWQAFREIYQLNRNAEFNFFCIINWKKWATLGNTDKLFYFYLKRYFPYLKISPVKIKNPDNPDELRDAVLITYKI